MDNENMITAVGILEGSIHQTRIAVHPTPHICSMYWTDINNKKIKKTLLQDTVRCHVLTQGIGDGSNVKVLFMDDDGVFNSDDLIYQTQISICQNKGFAELVIPHSWIRHINDDVGSAIELYIQCKYKSQVKEFTDEILRVEERGEVITIFIELPHSSETEKLSRKGLGGHTAIMIREEFYDYGPQPCEGASILGSEGRPWWDDPNLTKNDFLNIMDDEESRRNMSIVGKCICLDIHVDENECNKVQKWWEDKYKEPGRYSIYIANGDQCTTTVRKSLEKSTSIFDVFSFAEYTQTPHGLVELLTTHAKHTCGRDKGQLVSITKEYEEIIK